MARVRRRTGRVRGATVLFSGATEERLDIRSPAGFPAFCVA
jgi:hypothetical protein